MRAYHKFKAGTIVGASPFGLFAVAKQTKVTIGKSPHFFGQPVYSQLIVTLITNLLISLLQSSLKRRWGFSGLATMVRIVLTHYLNLQTFFNQPDADLKILPKGAADPTPLEADSE